MGAVSQDKGQQTCTGELSVTDLEGSKSFLFGTAALIYCSTRATLEECENEGMRTEGP
jgi:hypothetical protein